MKLVTWKQYSLVAYLGNMPVGICLLAEKRGRTEKWAIDVWLPNEQGHVIGHLRYFPSQQSAKDEFELVAAEWLRSAGLSPRRDGPIVDRFSPEELIEIADRTNTAPETYENSGTYVYDFEDGWSVCVDYYDCVVGVLCWIEHDGKKVFNRYGDDFLTRQFQGLRAWKPSPSSHSTGMTYEIIETDDGDRLRALKAHPRSARGRR